MPAIAIVSVNKDRGSETFVHNHVRHLPGELHFLTGDWLPLRHCRGLDGADEDFVPGHVADGGDGPWQERRQRKSERAEAITRTLRAEGIAAVLAEYGLAGVEMMGICDTLGIPLIVHFHGFDAYRRSVLDDPAYGGRYPELFARAHALIVVSRDMHEQLLRLGAPPEKLHLNPCGFDADLFTPHDAGARPPRCLAVGRFTDKKAPHLTLLAFARLHRHCADASLVVVGDGPLLAPCRSLVSQLGIGKAVRFPGLLPHADVAAEMDAARIFVQHSVVPPDGDSEGTPVAVIEASAAGLPVVATRHGGIPDVVVPEGTGLLVAEGDVAGMADALLRLARDSALATELGRAGRERVQTGFSLASHIDRLWEVIASGIGRG